MVPVIRSWWQKIKTHPTITVLIMISLLVFLLIGGYKLNWSWTGFNGADKTDKTLYDWLQLLIIPAIIAFIGLWYSQVQKNTEQKIAAQRYEQEQNLALDKQREDLL